MFNSLLNTLKSTTSALTKDPHAIAATAIALNRYRECGSLLIQDSSIEERVLPAAEGNVAVESAAIFGFKDHLRVLFHVRLAGQLVAVVLTLTPKDIVWTEERHTMSFDYELERIEPLSMGLKLGKAALKKLFKELVPLGGVISSIAGFAAGKCINTLGLATIESWEGLGSSGIRMQNGVATVDLEAQEVLSPLWERFDPDKLVGGSVVGGLLSRFGGPSPTVASMVEATSFRADREGLHITMELSPQARTIFEATAGLLSTSPS